jgi:hypothetical protein
MWLNENEEKKLKKMWKKKNEEKLKEIGEEMKEIGEENEISKLPRREEVAWREMPRRKKRRKLSLVAESLGNQKYIQKESWSSFVPLSEKLHYSLKIYFSICYLESDGRSWWKLSISAVLREEILTLLFCNETHFSDILRSMCVHIRLPEEAGILHLNQIVRKAEMRLAKWLEEKLKLTDGQWLSVRNDWLGLFCLIQWLYCPSPQCPYYCLVFWSIQYFDLFIQCSDWLFSAFVKYVILSFCQPFSTASADLCRVRPDWREC